MGSTNQSPTVGVFRPREGFERLEKLGLSVVHVESESDYDIAYFDGDAERWIEQVPSCIPRVLRHAEDDRPGGAIAVESVVVDSDLALGSARRSGYPEHVLHFDLSDAIRLAMLSGLGRPAARTAPESDRKRWCRSYRNRKQQMGGDGRLRRALVVTGFGGPYGLLGRLWVHAFRTLGVQAAIGLGDGSELRDWVPDIVVVLYVRSAWSRSRDFFRTVSDSGIPIVFLSYEDPYETRRFSQMFRALKPRIVLSTDPGVLLSGAYGPDAWYAPHCWSPALVPSEAEEAAASAFVEAHEAGGGGPIQVVSIGHNYASRFEFFASYPAIWNRFRWLTIGADYHLNMRGVQLKETKMSMGIALAARVGLSVNLHRDLLTSWERFNVHVAATNMNLTVVQMAACGVPQISDFRPSLEHHFGDSIPTYSTPVSLYHALDRWLADPSGADEPMITALRSRSRYIDRVIWVAAMLGLDLPASGMRVRESRIGQTDEWDPIRASSLREFPALCKPGPGSTVGQAGRIVM